MKSRMELPPLPGSYILIMQLPSEAAIDTGALGRICFKKGFYCYVGSAMGGLRRRVTRHIEKRGKRPRWHIDYFLEAAQVRTVLWSCSSKRLECDISAALAVNLPCIKGFGSGDCGCEGHLFYCESLEELLQLAKDALVSAGCMGVCALTVDGVFEGRTKGNE